MGNKKFKKSSKGSNKSGKQTSNRERNLRHKSGEEHSVKKKGNTRRPVG